jgi:hypothetical protein
MAREKKVVSVQLVVPNIRTVVLQVWMDTEDHGQQGTAVYHVLAIRDILYDDGDHITRLLLADTDCQDDDLPDIRYIEGTNCSQRVVACPWPMDQDEERFKPILAKIKRHLEERLANEHKET